MPLQVQRMDRYILGESKAKEIVRHSQEIQAQGAQYCDCPACAIVEDILKTLEG